MKDSGIKWIGDIPENWSISKFKYVKSKSSPYPIGDGDHGSVKPSMYQDSGIPYIRVQNLSWGNDLKLEDVVYISSEVNNANKKSWLFPGDLLVAKTGGTIGKTAIIPDDIKIANTTSSVGKITIDKEYSNKFYFYVLGSKICERQMWEKAEQKSAQPGFNIEDIETFVIPLPPFSEQIKIADFLDAKCSEIDNLTKDIETQIETLEQYKKSVISEAVTKGLNSDAEMKESGVGWIGRMPSDWRCIRGKFILKYVQKPVRSDDGIITCFRDGEVTLRSNRREEGFTMADKEIGYQGIDVGDLVVHGMDGFAGAIGISDSRGKASPVLNVLDTDMDKKYVMYYLRSMAYSDVFLALATGIRVRSCDLRWNKLAELFYPIPPIDEQKNISKYIDGIIVSTNDVIEAKKEQLATLGEYKKSIIYEYVTGKKEVA